MISHRYFPNTEDTQIVWLSRYALKLPINGPICGITPEEITSTLADIAYWTWMLQYWHPAMQRDAKEATAHKQLMITGGTENVSAAHPQSSQFINPPPAPLPNMQKRLFSQIVRIKASPNYTDVIGQDFGIIAISNKVEHLIPEPTISVELGETGNRVRIDFKKHEHEGVWIECRINGVGDWVFLAIDTIKPYYDERPLISGSTHESREYRLRWWDKSVAHGEWSVTLQITIAA